MLVALKHLKASTNSYYEGIKLTSQYGRHFFSKICIGTCNT